MSIKYNSQETAEKIVAILKKELATEEVSIEDQSRFHVGHRAAGGGGHFAVTIRSARFNGLSPIARQRLVLEAVGIMMDNEVHALTVKCLPTN